MTSTCINNVGLIRSNIDHSFPCVQANSNLCISLIQQCHTCNYLNIALLLVSLWTKVHVVVHKVAHSHYHGNNFIFIPHHVLRHQDMK